MTLLFCKKKRKKEKSKPKKKKKTPLKRWGSKKSDFTLQRAGWVNSGTFLSQCISDIIRHTDLFMNFTEASLTDPFIAVFIAAQTER